MTCPKCGSNNPDGAPYCVACGNPLPLPAPPAYAPPPSSGYPPQGYAPPQQQPYNPGPPPAYGQAPPQQQYGQPPAVQSYNPGPPAAYIPGPPQGYGQPAQPKVPNYMVQSILVTLCCCLPLGIVGIVNATKISKMLQSGDFQGAVKLSGESKKWLWVGFGVGIFVNVAYVIFQLASHH